MIVLLSPLVCAIIGLLMYALCVNPKLSEIGRIMFFVGMLWLIASVGSAIGGSGIGATPNMGAIRR
jgi:Na+/phosphate symporter